jgi:hypothetical protein
MNLTTAQCDLINSAVHTHNYEEEAVAEYEATGDDGIERFTIRFEQETGLKNGNDIGGLVVYFKENELTAFYDYENFTGAVF